MAPLEHLTREELIRLVQALGDQVGALEARNKILQEQIQQLQSRLGGGGAPPPAVKSVPDWVKPNKPARSKQPRKKRAFAFVRRREEPTRIVEHAPDLCPDCGRKLCEGTLHHSRQVIDIPYVPVEVTEHRFLARWCGVCRKRVVARADLCAQVLGSSRIGVGLMSLIAYLATVCRMPVRTLRSYLLAYYGLHISVGEIVDILRRCAEAGEPLVVALLSHIRSSPVVHADETGWREDGVNGYVWSFSTPDTRYYIRSPSRSSKVPQEVLGEQFAGRLVTDFYSAYSYYLGEHQRCWAHLLRELKKLMQEHPQNPSVEEFVAAVTRMFREGRDYSHQDARARLHKRFELQERLHEIARPFVKQPVPQRVLAERIERHLCELFVFVEHTDTPPDNNAAERAIRPAVTARKVSGGTRSPAGSATMSVLRSLFGTWHVRGHDLLGCCRQMLCGTITPDGNPA